MKKQQRHPPVSVNSSKLVEEIKKHPALYDPSDPEYRNMEHKNVAWRLIADLHQLPVTDCQLRWKSLRDRYVREKKLFNRNPLCNVTWPLFNQLSFLNSYISHKTQIKDENNGGLKLSDEEDESSSAFANGEESFESRTEEYEEEPAVTPEIGYESSHLNGNGSLGAEVADISIRPISASEPRVHGRKRPFDEDKIQELLARVANRMEPDEDELFFLSCAKMLKKVPTNKRASIKVKIMQLIDDEQRSST